MLASGTAAGPLVVVATSSVFTRLYSPEDFGLLADFAGLLCILSVIGSLQYQLAIPLPESKAKSAPVLVLSLFVVLGMTVVATLVVVLFATQIVPVLHTPHMAPYLWLLPVGLLFVGVDQVFTY